MYDESSQCSLKCLFQYMADGYSVTFEPVFTDSFMIGVTYFDGLISKKRTVNNYTAVDS